MEVQPNTDPLSPPPRTLHPVLVMDLPTKGNGRPGFHGSAILLLQQGMEAGTSLAVRPCLSFLPCLIQARPWKTKKQAKDQRVRFIYLKIHFLSRHLP
jgi:hypothetical protein